jgi:hypothetical protein
MVDILVVMIVFGSGAYCLRMVLDHAHKSEQLKARGSSVLAPAQTSEIERLREEVRSLRETTAQHSLSLQHLMETLDQRVSNLEARSRTASYTEEPAENRLQSGR